MPWLVGIFLRYVVEPLMLKELLSCIRKFHENWILQRQKELRIKQARASYKAKLEDMSLTLQEKEEAFNEYDQAINAAHELKSSE